MKLAANRQFIKYRRFLCGGHLLDLDWLFSTYLTEEFKRLDTIFELINPIYVCTTNIESCEAEYILVHRDNYKQLFKASMALPYVYRDFPQIDNSLYTDGGVADSIPVNQAIKLGAKKIIVIRARHFDYLKSDTAFHRLIRLKLRAYPNLVKKMKQRVQLHHESICLIRNPPIGVKIIEVCPPDEFDVGRLSRNIKSLTRGYNSGFLMAEKIIEDWNAP